MNISQKLTQQQLQEILENIYKKGHESKEIRVKDIIEELKRQILSAISS